MQTDKIKDSGFNKEYKRMTQFFKKSGLKGVRLAGETYYEEQSYWVFKGYDNGDVTSPVVIVNKKTGELDYMNLIYKKYSSIFENITTLIQND